MKVRLSFGFDNKTGVPMYCWEVTNEHSEIVAFFFGEELREVTLRCLAFMDAWSK